MVLGPVEVEEVAGDSHEREEEFEATRTHAFVRRATWSASAGRLDDAAWSLGTGAVAVRLRPRLPAEVVQGEKQVFAFGF